MIGNKISNIKIVSTETFILSQEYLVTNEMIYEYLYGKNWINKIEKEKIEYLENKLGLKNRFLIQFPRKKKLPDYTSVDLMFEAGKKILKNFDKNKIGLVIGTSTTSPKYTTSMAAILSGKLGILSASFDMKSGCSSMISALIIAAQFVKLTKKTVLILSGETLSKIAKDKFFFHASDMGAAILLEYTKDKSGIEKFFFETDGKYSDMMGVKGILPPTKKDLENQKYFFSSEKNFYDIIKEKWKLVPNMLLRKSKFEIRNIKVFISNQVNKELIEIARKEIGISNERTIDLVNEIGNSGQTSFLFALDYALKNKKISAGDLLFLQAVGGGLSYGGILWRC